MKGKATINIHTIKWIRGRVKLATISSSLNDLLLEKEKSKPMLLQILENSNKISTYVNRDDTSSKNSLKLKPEMFFSKLVLEKIYQIRDIFLEFDADRSRTLEISELLEMFNSNNIPITQDEMIDLFSTGKRKKISQYRMTFYEIIMLYLDPEYCCKFRRIMKGVKERAREAYVPLDLHRALEFIYSKGKIKNGLLKITKGIANLDKMNKKILKGNINRERPSQLYKDAGTSLLSKWGIGKAVNVNKVCKGFNDVIEASKDLMDKTMRKALVRRLRSYHQSLSERYDEHKRHLTENSTSRFNTTALTIQNTSLPLLTISKQGASIQRKIMSKRKADIDYLFPHITSLKHYHTENRDHTYQSKPLQVNQ